MGFLHKREYAEAGDVVEVNCTHRCNVLVMGDSDFSAYRSRRSFRYLGGHFDRLPARIVVPHSDNWNIVLDLGGGSANIRSSMRIIKAA